MILTDTTELRVFKCPASPQSADSSGTLNYVINAGFIDRELYYRDPEGQHEPGRLSWDGNDLPNEERDAQVGLATGVCWRENNRRRFTFDDVQSGDGTAHTLLFTENLQAGPWQSTDTEKIGFGVPVSALNGRIPYGPGTQFESIYKPLNTSFRGSTISSASSRDWLINAENAPGDAPRPRPSSNHQGGVNAVFCDGHVQFLSETIDPHVYVKLVTSNGAAFGENAVPAKGY